jgi:hypothetical protein
MEAIRTERLLLRPLHPDDAEAIGEFPHVNTKLVRSAFRTR